MRWLSPLLPVLSLLALHGFYELVTLVPRHQQLAKAVGLVVLIVPSAWGLAFQNARNSSFNTRMQALEWVRAHVPKDAMIAYEWYAAPLNREPFKAREHHALPAGGSLEDYEKAGYRYLIVSSAMYDRFLKDPGRFSDETRFYRALFSAGKLEARFQPSRAVGGPEIRVYSLRAAQPSAPPRP
jgi:hypothetical protein